MDEIWIATDRDGHIIGCFESPDDARTAVEGDWDGGPIHWDGDSLMHTPYATEIGKVTRHDIKRDRSTGGAACADGPCCN